MDSKPLDLTVHEMERKIMKVTHKEAAECDKHGVFVAYFTSVREGGSRCPACADEDQRANDQKEREELHLKIMADQLAARLGSAMIPPRFQGSTFKTYHAEPGKQEKVLSVCKEYAENFKSHYRAGRSLLLLGNVGTGKTHLASAIAHHVVTEHGYSAMYRTVYGILQHIKGSFNRESEYNEMEAFAAFIKPHLLIIDEVGATKTTEFEQQTLFNIINGRYEQQVPTIVISNLKPDELSGALGERCVDRLREGGGIAQVFTWGSARKKIIFGEDQ